MVIEERPELEAGKSDTNSPEVSETLPAETGPPVVPKGMSDEEARKVQEQAVELLRRLEGATGSEELRQLEGVTNVGVQSQRNAAGQLDLLKARMGTLLNEGGTSGDIAEGLRDLRLTLEQINPHEMAEPGVWDRIFGALPYLKGRYNPVVRALNKIALRYEPVSSQVTQIETNLRDGQALLARDNVELRQLYKDVETQQPPIKRNAYLGELIAQRLSRLLEQTEDPMKSDRMHGALNDVMVRVQDMRTMQEVHLQYCVSIEMSWQNNNRLAQSVERTLALATNVVTVGLAIQSALVRQKGVMEANQTTREFLGELIAANAGAINRHTQEIGDLYNNPVVSMEKIAEAHDDLIEALDAAGRSRQEGIEAARDNIATLSEMSSNLEERVSGLVEESDRGPESVEARTSEELA